MPKKKPNLKKKRKKENPQQLTNPFQNAQLYKQCLHQNYRICLGKLSQIKHLKHFLDQAPITFQSAFSGNSGVHLLNVRLFLMSSAKAQSSEIWKERQNRVDKSKNKKQPS